MMILSWFESFYLLSRFAWVSFFMKVLYTIAAFLSFFFVILALSIHLQNATATPNCNEAKQGELCVIQFLE